ncbi:MAG: hypothetical protein HN685_02170 [Waddliaceae bacterium]|nr:hypothetical protein [Waddliaceae bacterium]
MSGLNNIIQAGKKLAEDVGKIFYKGALQGHDVVSVSKGLPRSIFRRQQVAQHTGDIRQIPRKIEADAQKLLLEKNTRKAKTLAEGIIHASSSLAGSLTNGKVKSENYTVLANSFTDVIMSLKAPGEEKGVCLESLLAIPDQPSLQDEDLMPLLKTFHMLLRLNPEDVSDGAKELLAEKFVVLSDAVSGLEWNYMLPEQAIPYQAEMLKLFRDFFRPEAFPKEVMPKLVQSFHSFVENVVQREKAEECKTVEEDEEKTIIEDLFDILKSPLGDDAAMKENILDVLSKLSEDGSLQNKSLQNRIVRGLKETPPLKPEGLNARKDKILWQRGKKIVR